MASMSRSGHETGLIWIQTACYVGGHEGRQALKPLHASTKRRLQKHRAASSRRRSASDHPDSTRIVFNMDLSKARWPRRQRSLATVPPDRLWRLLHIIRQPQPVHVRSEEKHRCSGTAPWTGNHGLHDCSSGLPSSCFQFCTVHAADTRRPVL